MKKIKVTRKVKESMVAQGKLEKPESKYANKKAKKTKKVNNE